MVSVIIPTFNRAEMVVRCVQSVLETGYPDLEVIVVDDCSPEDVRGRLAVAFPSRDDVRCVRTPRNLMVAGARNFGARQARGDLLLFLDNDNIIPTDMVAELEKALRSLPNAGFVGALSIHRSAEREGRIWTLTSHYNPWTSRPIERGANARVEDIADLQSAYETDYAPNCSMVSREVFEAVGGFDASFGMMYEEADFGLRIVEAGYRGYLSTRARTDHFGFLDPGCAPRLRQLGIERPRRTFCFARNRLRFARKHFNFLQILSVTLVFAPLSCAYYCGIALRNRRPDIAWAYLKGTFAGILGIG